MFENLSKELYKRAIELAKQGYTIRQIKKMLKKEFGKYNTEVANIIEEQLSVFDEMPPDLLTGVALSDALYNNAKQIVNSTSYLIADQIKSKKTIKELSKKLYAGYGFQDKEVLEVKKKLPKYIKKELSNPKTIKYIEKLKTKHLKTAYSQIFEKIDKVGEKAFSNAIHVALEEKARFYADRIAHTELFRAKNYQNAVEYLDDDEINFVRFIMSTKHPMVDICDFYANLDVGYGRGIVPKEQMVTLPLHPFCRCRYVPVHNDRKLKNMNPKREKKAIMETMAKFSEYEQARILGSREKVQLFHAGADIEDIFNSVRPKYPIVKYADIVKGSENINEFILQIENKQIKQNEVTVGVIDSEVADYLNKVWQGIYRKIIILDVAQYMHLLRDYKQSKGKAISKRDVILFKKYLKTPVAVYFDTIKKHKNLIYVCNSEVDGKLFKIVVSIKYGKIITAGKISKNDLNNRLYIKIK